MTTRLHSVVAIFAIACAIVVLAEGRSNGVRTHERPAVPRVSPIPYDNEIAEASNDNKNKLIGHMGWVLGAVGQSCAATCSSSGGTCNAKRLTVVSSSNIQYVAGLLSANCTTINAGNSGQDPSYAAETGDCWTSSPLSDCNTSPAVFLQRFCCCSTLVGACPTASPTLPPSTTVSPIPGNMGWVLSRDQGSCIAECAAVGGRCNAAAQTAVNGTVAVQYVASLLGISCVPVLSGQSWDPSFTAGQCFYGTKASDCTSTAGGQRFCCCSTAKGACPALPPTPPGNQGWVLSQSEGNCVNTCGAYGATCNAAAQAAVSTSLSVTYVASLLNLTCSPQSSAATSNPSYADGQCDYGNAGSDCVSSISGQRFCCCSSSPGACPSTPPPVPGNQGWVLGEAGGNCVSACASVGATCNVNAQNAVNTSAATAFVANLLRVGCSVSQDAGHEGYDPMVTSQLCFFSTDAESDCTSSYPGSGPYMPGRRFCCCSSVPGACPTG